MLLCFFCVFTPIIYFLYGCCPALTVRSSIGHLWDPLWVSFPLSVLPTSDRSTCVLPLPNFFHLPPPPSPSSGCSQLTVNGRKYQKYICPWCSKPFEVEIIFPQKIHSIFHIQLSLLPPPRVSLQHFGRGRKGSDNVDLLELIFIFSERGIVNYFSVQRFCSSRQLTSVCSFLWDTNGVKYSSPQ